jgi:hypothetical protein
VVWCDTQDVLINRCSVTIFITMNGVRCEGEELVFNVVSNQIRMFGKVVFQFDVYNLR